MRIVLYSHSTLCCLAAVLMVAGALLDAYQRRRREEYLDESEVLALLDHEKQQNGGLSTKTISGDNKSIGRNKTLSKMANKFCQTALSDVYNYVQIGEKITPSPKDAATRGHGGPRFAYRSVGT